MRISKGKNKGNFSETFQLCFLDEFAVALFWVILHQSENENSGLPSWLY
jgi:hypothetical protein